MSVRTHWRDCDEWRKSGVTLSTTSNEACKLYDAVLTQFLGFYQDDSLGGVEACIGNMIQADPTFVMGHVMANGFDLMGAEHTTRMDPEFKARIDNLVQIADNSVITETEKMHVNAVKLYADGYQTEANDVWERILIKDPYDLLALKLSYISYIFTGPLPQLRDSVARILPSWKPNMPNYGYLLGMHCFGLQETNLFGQAEKIGKKALEINPQDAWATHAMAHVMEMTGRQQDGIKFMGDSANNWACCQMLRCHNYWHWALYHVEKGEYEAALDIFDSEIAVQVKKPGASVFNAADGSSLLFRLQMEGVDVGDRWNDLYDLCKTHIDDHISCFNDAHILLSCVGAKQQETAQRMIQSLKEFISCESGTMQQRSKEVGVYLCEALVAYEEGDYEKAVDLTYPIRYKIVNIGGSTAQRDLFNIFLINAAIKSSSKEHNRLARLLLAERKSIKDSAPLTDRLMAKALACHID